MVEQAIEQKSWDVVREARLCAPSFLINTLELEFPEGLPDEAYAEPEETTGDVEMKVKPEAPVTAPGEPAPAGAV
eukprot:11054195-Alexandrium_andersonii.AAC.1